MKKGASKERVAVPFKLTRQVPLEEGDHEAPENHTRAGLSCGQAGKRGGGRPTRYLPESCDYVVAMGAVGYSKAQIARELWTTRQTLDNWSASYPEFSTAMTHAREMSLGWWESQGQAGIWAGKQFNVNAYSLQMRNRFPDEWRERSSTAIGHPGGARAGPSRAATETVPTDFDELRAIIATRG